MQKKFTTTIQIFHKQEYLPEWITRDIYAKNLEDAKIQLIRIVDLITTREKKNSDVEKVAGLIDKELIVCK